MSVTITYDGAVPTVGGDEDTWGDELNASFGEIKVDLDALAVQGNANETAIGAVEDDITALEALIAQAAHTGDIKFGVYATAPSGWIKANGGTIGNAASGATTRANADTELLFSLLWASVDVTVLPIYDSAGVLTTKGVSNTADFAANKRLAIPDMRANFVRGFDDGRGVDTSRALGSYQADDNKAHTHTVTSRVDDSPNTAIAGGSGAGSGSETTSSNGSEARPKNIAALAVIKL